MFQYNTIEEALEALRNGEIILVTDDEDRENEGDMICAAQFATTENVNFMAAYAKGLICMPMSIELSRRLNLSQMVETNTDNHCTAFTVSIDHVGTTTGISAEKVFKGILDILWLCEIISVNSKNCDKNDFIGATEKRSLRFFYSIQ